MNHLPPLPWLPGTTLITQETRRWSAEKFDQNEREENLRIFSNFHAEDQGRSRLLLCTLHRSEYTNALMALFTQAPRLLDMLIRIHAAEFGYGGWPEEGEITKLINEAGGII